MRRSRAVAGIVVAGLLLPALGLTALRLLAPEQGLAVRLTSFAPVALLLYAGVLLVAVPGWLRRRRESDGAVLPVLLALAGLGLHGWWLAPHWSGESGAAEDPAYRLEVMTTNLLKGAGDTTQVMQAAAEHRVDLLVVQEITPGSLRALERLGLREAFPHRAGTTADDPSGTMVFSTAPLADVTRLETEFGSLAMTVRTDDGPLRLLAVHPRPPLGDAGTWRDELEVVRKSVADPRGFDLVVGDFNASDDHAPMRRILADGDLRDAAEQANAGWQPTWPMQGAWKVGPVPLPRSVAIDHVLVGKRLWAEQVDAVTIDGSDHRALVAHLVPSADRR